MMTAAMSLGLCAGAAGTAGKVEVKAAGQSADAKETLADSKSDSKTGSKTESKSDDKTGQKENPEEKSAIKEDAKTTKSESKSGDKKSEEKKTEDNKSDDRKTEDNKSDDKETEDKETEDKKSEDKKSEDKKSEDRKSDSKEAEDKEEAEDQAVTHEFTKVTDYLFETTYDDYEEYEAAAKDYFEKFRPQLGGCSSVQNGVFRGRNYDWTFDEEPEFVIHVPAAEGRHASLGVAATSAITAQFVESGDPSEVYNWLPYSTLDGINDAGLTVNVNVVNFGEMGEFVMKTEDTDDDVCPLMITRKLLDGAGSIDEALEMLEEMDVYSLGNAEEAHLLISGPQSEEDDTFNTVCVEFIPDKDKHYQLSVIDYNKGEFVDDKPIMTNFHLTGFDGSKESLTKHPMGYERYLILSDNFDQGQTKTGMIELMKKVYYTRNYDLYKDNFWYSEYASEANGLDMTNVGKAALNGDISKAGDYAEEVQKAIDTFEAGKRDASFWHTVHTSVYDTENKTLSILPQEAGYAYEFELESDQSDVKAAEKVAEKAEKADKTDKTAVKDNDAAVSKKTKKENTK